MQAKLEHCLGVAYHEGAIYIADTYNNKIKRLDLSTKEVVTVLGSGEAGEMYEPGGLSVWEADGAARLYVADTNNHRVLVFGIDAEGNLSPAVAIEVVNG